MSTVIDQTITEDYALYNGDCVPVTAALPANSVHFIIYSPPFSNLYTYSDSLRDMGNSDDDDHFFAHYEFLIPELYRILKPGRLAAVHCKQLVNYRGRDGMAGLRDFRGEIIRAHLRHGWPYHSEVVIWKDPVLEMQKTKAHGLLHKQLCADSTFSRQGLAEYLVLFRKWAAEGEEIEPVTRDSVRVRFTDYIGANPPSPAEYRHAADPERQYSIAVWQRYASPVWMDIRQTRVLNTEIARDDQDEKHMAPLQLDVIERSVELWTNPGDIVYTPFLGVGSEVVGALSRGRRGVGVELKPSYYQHATRYCAQAVAARQQPNLLQLIEASV